MPTLGDLLGPIPDSKDISISSEGYALWVTWLNSPNSPAGLDPFVTKILQDYGALQIREEDEQSLWFFFSSDILLSLAKLNVWNNQKKERVSFTAMTARLDVTLSRKLCVIIKPELHYQVIDLNSISYKHASIDEPLAALAKYIPGVNLNRVPVKEGLADNGWVQFSADSRLPYNSKQGWFTIIHPIGNPLEPGFYDGWENAFRQLEEIIKIHKFKYIIHSNYLILPIDSLRMLRICVQEVIELFLGIRERDEEKYWPCTWAVVDKRNLNYSDDLPQKVGLNWESLRPDYPYITYHNAFLLGDNFSIQDVHFSSASTDIDNWCTVDLVSNASVENSLNVLMPSQLLSTNTSCFYCGSGSHEALKCPTRKLAFPNLKIWDSFTGTDIDSINRAYRNIDLLIEKNGEGAYKKIFQKKELEATILEAVFSINSFVQVPSIGRVWAMSGRDMLQAVSSEKKTGPIYDLLTRFEQGGINILNSLSREINGKLEQNTKDWLLYSLLGFVYMELNEFEKADKAWYNAQSFSTMTIHQAWTSYLRARLFEVTAKYDEAKKVYEKVSKLLPNWKEPAYRVLTCDVKMGFGESTTKMFVKLVEDDPSLFHKVLLDPELDRGRKQIIGRLNSLWDVAQRLANLDRQKLEDLQKQLHAWFPDIHRNIQTFGVEIEHLLAKAEINNYLDFLEISSRRPALEEAVKVSVQAEVETLETSFRRCLGRVEIIRDEISWFPIRGVSKDFMGLFTEVTDILNWAFASDFRNAIVFKEASEKIIHVRALVKKMEKNLRNICIMRDSALFLILSLKSFIKYGIGLFFIGFATLFCILFFGDAIKLGWMRSMILSNFWGLQTVLLSIIVVLSLGFSALKTTLIFEKKREQLINGAKKQREISQEQRLQKVQRLRAEAIRRATMKLEADERMNGRREKKNA